MDVLIYNVYVHLFKPQEVVQYTLHIYFVTQRYTIEMHISICRHIVVHKAVILYRYTFRLY